MSIGAAIARSPLPWVLLLACGDAAEAPGAAVDTDALVAQVATDPAGAAATVRALPDPLARTAAVVALADAGAPLPHTFCDGLGEGPARERCFKISSRPHLTTHTPDGRRDAARAAEGPSSIHIVPTANARSAYADRAPIDVDCGQRPALECRAELARKKVLEGDFETAAGLCAGVPEQRWREECHFGTAEIAASRRDETAATQSAELCLLAGYLMPRCFDHAARRLGAAAPAADAPPKAWKTLLALNRTIERPWAKRDPGFGRHMRDRFWSYATLRAASLTRVATGKPLDHLPSEAHRHVRSAVAMRVMSEQVAVDASLAEAEAALAGALAHRPDGPAPRGKEPLAVGHPPPHWAADGEGDEHLVATFHLGSGRRTWSPDPVVDGRIALVEAAGLVDPPRRLVIEEASAHEEPLTRWTGLRVLADLHSGRTAVGEYEMPLSGDASAVRGNGPPLADDDPRVRAANRRR